ncbi:hypothetical protein RB195_001756 [Necator americanus]|uniref:Uncharacterized protein n=1 Tax=Necator americanus TaxID=51031 RepID=A0ABR1DIN2_NECAM
MDDRSEGCEELNIPFPNYLGLFFITKKLLNIPRLILQIVVALSQPNDEQKEISAQSVALIPKFQKLDMEQEQEKGNYLAAGYIRR